MKYIIEITETLQREIEVEAPSIELAEKRVRQRYFDAEIILDSDDHKETEFSSREEN